MMHDQNETPGDPHDGDMDEFGQDDGVATVDDPNQDSMFGAPESAVETPPVPLPPASAETPADTGTQTASAAPASDTPDSDYEVLALKYRPKTFDQLIGQDALVRTLSNAIETGRLAHAFVLTGVRGVGKTTTARIIARALNCIGPDGNGGPTTTPCGVCDNCRSISDDRHVDVMEMDAASRTGVDDIREILDGVRYLPVSARYKVYIIDEVHMLTRNAFNALLKTLEEPPKHVKFIFATTEIRKVPVTVLSRCQRFDLKRIEAGEMITHMEGICRSEKADVAEGALKLIARAGDGSARDSLSLLDQAIAHGGGSVDENQVRDMLGLADRARVFDLFEYVMRGKIGEALDDLKDQYNSGADPLVVLNDLLELTHWLTRLKVTPSAADDGTLPETERQRGMTFAQGLDMPTLTRCWQMLLKGLEEARHAPSPLSATEMVLVRLAYVSELPGPEEIIRKLRDGTFTANGPAAPAGPAPGGGPGGGGSGPGGSFSQGGAALAVAVSNPAPVASPDTLPAMAPAAVLVEDLSIDSLLDISRLAKREKELLLNSAIRNNIHLVAFDGRAHTMDFRPTDTADPDLANRLTRFLKDMTGDRWIISVCADEGAPTLKQQEEAAQAAAIEEMMQNPLIKTAMEVFPGAELIEVKTEE